MSLFEKILYAVALIGLAFMVYYTIRSNPSWFTMKNFSKSASVLGVLALGLIAFIGLLVFMLRH